MEKTIQELVKEERRLYAKEWRAKNPDKVREANRRYWEKRVQQRIAGSAAQAE